METPLIKTGKKRSRRALFGDDNNDDNDHDNILAVGEDTDKDSASDEAVHKNLCIICDVDMGEHNPRQLCGKSKCLNEEIMHTDDHDGADNATADEPDTFISLEDFAEAVDQEKPIKWVDLDQDKVYRVLAREERTFTEDNGNKRVAPIGIFKDEKGIITKVWLPTVVTKKLSTKMGERVTTYLKPKGSVLSQKTGRKYHDADVITKKC